MAGDSAKVVHKPRLLSDNASSYISSDLAEWLKDRGIAHVRGALCHPQTQGKIERWHRRSRTAFCSRTITCPVISKSRSRASSSNHSETDAGRRLLRQSQTFLLERERIKRDTIKLRRLQYQLKAA